MKTDFEDDVRAMLRRHAAEATTSPNAWEQIQARLEGNATSTSIVSIARRRPFQVVAGGAAAAALAAMVVGQALPSTTERVATQPPASTAPAAVEVPDTPWVWPADASSQPPITEPLAAATAYLEDRTGGSPTDGELTSWVDGEASVLFLSGPVLSEVFLTEVGGRWFVKAASSDLVPKHMLTYDGERVTGEVMPESAGQLTLRIAGGDGEPVIDDPRGQVAFREPVAIDQLIAGEEWVTTAAVLRTADGTIALSEHWQRLPDEEPTDGDVDDGFQGIWPARSANELAGLDDAVRSGEQPWLEDAAEVALAFLEGEVLGVGGEVTATTGGFVQGDQLSGEVPFELSDGGRGLVLVRRASPEARVWYVTFATTDGGPFDVRGEHGGITVRGSDTIAAFRAEVRPLPGQDVVAAEAEDDVLRFEGITRATVHVFGTTADGGTAFTVSRVSPAG